MRVCFGGTFDPFHLGHLAVARAVADATGAVVHLLPAADPPHRPPPGAGAKHRAAMLGLAIAGDDRLAMDGRELARPGRSWTVETLADLRAELGPRTPLAWVIGGDSLLKLDTWREWQRLLELAHLLVVPRPGLDLRPEGIARAAPAVWQAIGSRLQALPRLRQYPAGVVHLLPLPALRTESATDVRRRIAGGGDWRALLPDAVADYIVRHRLYGVGGPGAGEVPGAGGGV